MDNCVDNYASCTGRLKRIAKSAGIGKMDPRRKEICIAGMELCVLKESDIIYILTGAESETAAERRLVTRISEA